MNVTAEPFYGKAVSRLGRPRRPPASTAAARGRADPRWRHRAHARGSHSAITSLMKAMAAHRRHIVADGCYGVRMCRSEARCCSARNDDKWPIAADFGPAAVVARLVRDPAEHEAKRLRISAIITFVGRGSWQAARPVAPPGDSTDATRPPTPFHRALPLLYWLRHPRQVQWSCRSVRSSRELPASATECR